MPTPSNNETHELLNLIGEDAFTRLCTVFGGTRLHISNSVRSRQRLTVIVGEDNAEKIIFNYQGVALTLPMLSSLEIKKRHQSIIKDFENGMSQRDIAMKYDLTDRQVRRIISDS
ncbi:Mor transcription activator family protein [Nitrosomonas sp.]|uniref:Mor transcription activator family protein n=1 Tax=Nitrosomonas sp. TaxID=42353 RepID=UPI00262BEE36|nr:Mor transcription activator family protein [Nitrosomonas sp.]